MRLLYSTFACLPCILLLLPSTPEGVHAARALTAAQVPAHSAQQVQGGGTYTTQDNAGNTTGLAVAGGHTSFCQGVVPPVGARLMRSAGLGPGLYVYSKNDVVSASILRRQLWEPKDVHQLSWAMQQAVQPSTVSGSGASSQPQSGMQTADPIFVDIGANIGWFTLHLAHLGYTTLAFEGMHRNVQLLRASMCELEKINPSVASRIRLYPHGLGAAQDDCYVYSNSINVGDGHTMCGVKDLAEVTAKIPPKYAVRGKLHIERLDDVVKGPVQAMKIDIEGYELAVLHGGKELFTKHKVAYLVIEFNTACMRSLFGPTATTDFFTLLQSYGFQFSRVSLQGSWMGEQELRDLAASPDGLIINLYCAQRQTRQPIAVQPAAV